MVAQDKYFYFSINAVKYAQVIKKHLPHLAPKSYQIVFFFLFILMLNFTFV